MSSENDEGMVNGNSPDSPCDDGNSSGTMGVSSPLKKGPWTNEEDEILVEYVKKHGEGNWNAVQKHSGLARCGKSCRLRWANHLRPDLKKGPFSQDEERLIIELHAKIGNKWARMAAELPGRTDNEIKNFWNTRIKRRQRAGLPIYPPDICSRVKNDYQQGDDIDPYSTGDLHRPEFISAGSNFEIPQVEFKSLRKQQLYTLQLPGGNLLENSASSVLAEGLQPSYPNKSIVQSSKCLPGSELLFTGFNAAPVGNQFNCEGSLQADQTLGFSSPYDQAGLFPAVLTGTPSSSEPHWSMKVELPSLQNQIGSWGAPPPSFPLPVYEDNLIQTPQAEHTCILSPHNSGLLDDVLYQSESMKSKMDCYPWASHSSTTMATDILNVAGHDASHGTGWAYDDQLSPLGHSPSSVICESPPISVNSFDDPQSADGFPGSLPYDDRLNAANPMIFSRMDHMLPTCGPVEHPAVDPGLRGSGLSCEFKQVGRDAPSQGQDGCHSLYGWNVMPPSC